MSNTTASILIASDTPGDAEMVKNLLAPDFRKIFVSVVDDKAAEDFESRQPDVVVLAFNTLEKAERYYLGLYRRCKTIQNHPHRTVILCNKDEVKHVADLCMKQNFDDYVLFWPLNHDAPRLSMSVHLAVRELTSQKHTGPTAEQFAAQARELEQLEAMLEKQMSSGGKHIEAAGVALNKANVGVGAAIDGLTQRIGQGDLKDVLEVKSVDGLQQEMTRLKKDEIQKHFTAASEAVEPIKQWVTEVRKECEPHFESARTLTALASSALPLLLVVDDDDFQHKMVAKILGPENYRLLFASNGEEALGILQHHHPDLILMDVMMPDLDGLEMTRRIKGAPQHASIPVMMISGKSEGNIVVNCLKAGAVDFVVKPFDREILKSKVARLSRPKASAAPAPAPSSIVRIPL